MAPRRQTIPLPFPLRGVNKGFGLTSQPYLTTPSATNVRPESVGVSVAGAIDARRRGGSRPGLGKLYDSFSFGASIRLITTFSPLRGQTQQSYLDNFSGDGPEINPVWSQASWLATAKTITVVSAVSTTVSITTSAAHGLSVGHTVIISGLLPAGYNGTVLVTAVGSTTTFQYQIDSVLASPTLDTTPQCLKYAVPDIFPADADDLKFVGIGGAMRDAVDTLDLNKPYTISVMPTPYDGKHHGSYFIYARALNSGNGTGSLDATYSGIVVELNLLNGTTPSSSGHYSGEVTEYLNNATISTTALNSGNTGTADTEEFQVTIDKNRVRVSWGSVALGDFGVGAGGGYAFGFGFDATDATGTRPICLIDYIRFDYYKLDSVVVEPPLQVLISAGGKLWRETEESLTVEEVPTSATLASDRSLQAAQYQGTVYIADHGTPKVQGMAVNIDGSVITASSVDDWSIYDIDPATDLVVISDGSTAQVLNGAWPISVVGVAQIQMTNVVNGGASATATITIERAPKKYSSENRTLEFWNAKYVDDADPTDGRVGIMPTGCPLVCVYRDRIVLAGAQAAPQAWFMSRQGDPLDWDYSVAATDTGGAIAGVNTSAGVVSGPITALIPHSDDYLLFCTPNAIFILRGDPRSGGIIDALSREVGCVSKKAWCYGPTGEVVVFSYSGIYVIAPGAAAYPVAITDSVLPDDLAIPDDDRDQYEVFMEYDASDRGVHIFIVKTDESVAGRHYWMDWLTKGFFKVELPVTMEPFALCNLSRRYGKDSALFIGCRDGYLRAYRDAIEDDDGTTLTSTVLIGPIFVGRDRDCIIGSLTASMAEDSASVTWSILSGDTVQDAVESTTPTATGSWSEDRNYDSRPRVRARYHYIQLVGTGAWAMEEITMEVEDGGRHALL